MWRARQDSNLRPLAPEAAERRQPGAAWSRCPWFYWRSGKHQTTRNHREPLPIVSHLSVAASPCDPRSREAGASWLDNDKRADDPIAKLGNNARDGLTESASRITWEANQDDSSRPVPAGVHEESKILVFGEKNSCLGASQHEDRRVLRTGIDSSDCGDVVAGGSEGGHHGEVAALVGEKPHPLVSSSAGCCLCR